MLNKNLNAETVTKKEIKEFLQSGNDNKVNRICVFRNGDIEMISGTRERTDELSDSLLFKLRSFAPGNQYVGPTVDGAFASQVFNEIKVNWDQFKNGHGNPFTVE